MLALLKPLSIICLMRGPLIDRHLCHMAAKFGVLVDGDTFDVCLTVIKKNMSLNIVQQFMRGMVKIYYGLFKTLMRFVIN